MVVMVTPVAFASIGYKTYIIFAVINAFIVPVVYFFYVSMHDQDISRIRLTFHSPRQHIALWRKWTRFSRRPLLFSMS